MKKVKNTILIIVNKQVETKRLSTNKAMLFDKRGN